MKTNLLRAAVCAVTAISMITAFYKPSNAAVVIPRFVVTGRDLSSETVKAGEDFDMVIHMKNESQSKLTNIKFELKSEGNELINKTGTDSIYVDAVEKEGTLDVPVTMSARSDLLPGTYSVSLNYTYEEGGWKIYDDKAELLVPVKQVPKVSVTGMKISRDEMLTDSKATCSLSVNNIGKCEITNVCVALEGDNIISSETFIGRLDINENREIDIAVRSSSVGEGDIRAKVTYEDPEGKSGTVEKSIRLKVTEPVVYEAEHSEAPLWQNPFVLGGAAGIIVIIVIVAIVRKKREKAYA